MIYRVAKQISGMLVGALITVAVTWAVSSANAFPLPVLPAAAPAIVLPESVATTVRANSGSGSGFDADTLDGYDQSSFYKTANATQVNQTTALAGGGQEYWFTFGYSADQLVFGA